MAEKALRMKKEFLGQVFLLGSREPNPPKEINGVSGRYVQLQAECSREEQPAFFVYLTAEEDKRLRLPEKEVHISFEEAYFVFRKERVNSRETNGMGQTERRTTGYQDVGVFLTGVKIEEVL